MNRLKVAIFSIFITFLFSCEYPQKKEDTPYAQQVQSFLDSYEKEYQVLHAAWQKNVLSKAKSQEDSAALVTSQQRYEAFLGDKDKLSEAATYLKEIDKLTPIQVKQLQIILYDGTPFQQSLSTVLNSKRVALKQISTALEMPPFRLRNRYYAVQDLDSLFAIQQNEKVKAYLWGEKRKTTLNRGKELYTIATANNELVKASGYGNFFEYRAGAYQLTTQELLQLQQQFLTALRPLMAEIHTYLRYELASKYRMAVPNAIPIHWFADIEATRWEKLIPSPFLKLDDSLASESLSWVQKQTENYFKESGYPALGVANFDYLSKNEARVDAFNIGKNTLKITIKSGNSLTNCLELTKAFAKGQYMLAYNNPDVPLLLRRPISNSFELAHQLHAQKEVRAFMMDKYFPVDSTSNQDLYDEVLFYEAFYYVPRLVYILGVLQQFEFAIYANELEPEQFNYKWWELYERFMGIAPPTEITETYTDPLLTDLHQFLDISSTDYALGVPMMFQLNDKLENLPEDVKAYEFLQSFLYAGASYDPNRLYKEHFKKGLSMQELLNYFDPVYRRLRRINQGRKNAIPKWE